MPDNTEANLNASNVTTGKPKVGGAVFAAKLVAGLTIPTSPTETLDSAFGCLGYISDAGVTQSRSTDNSETTAWGGDVVLNSQTKYAEQFKMTFLEQRQSVWEQVYTADNVVVDSSGAVSIKHNANEHDEYCYVVDSLFKDGRIDRLVIPKGKVIEVGDVSRVDGDPMAYDATVSALPDGNGNSSYEYISAPVDSADAHLAALTIGTKKLTPSFSPTVYSYTASTTNSTNTITAVASDPNATIVIKNGETTVTNESSASWSAGSNTLTVTVTNGGASKVYTVTVTKS